MLSAELLPGLQTLPKVPEMPFLDVGLGVKPDWTRAALGGTLLGFATLAVVVLALRRGDRRF